ncbi:MAG TPA: hypothetical protein VHS81_11145 [Caulobacteraceae bacterium]|nr:hypothetical protein [Caulobacteraceae bacterium]
MPNPADPEPPSGAPSPPTPADKAAAPPPDEVFVRAIDLPTPSLRQARAAVAQQLDILSPLPPAEVVAAVVLIGPAEAGLNRYAVGLAPRRLLAEAPAEGRIVTLIGRLDGEIIAFRFERPRDGAEAGARDWIEIATIAGACLAILLAGANLRVDREIDATQARIDAADALVQQRSHEVAQVARVAGAWRAAAATRKAGVVDCALAHLVKASGGPVRVAGLAMAGGQLTARLADPPADAAALKALGLTPAAPPTVQTASVTGGPAGADAAPAPAGAAVPPALAQDFQTSAAACR